ncbi:MAG: SDR family oxidoreductase [Gammaproteobacteria bacterium]|nr:SDR family oxidoreductase [Gammaproteobacteria bacterium]
MTDTIKTAGNLQGYAVLVTGGGTGIGAGCAAALAADGAAVTISGRRAEVLEAAAESIASAAQFGGSVQIVTGDVTNEDDVQAMVEKALGPTGRLNGCIANAGGGGMLMGYEKMDTDEFIRVMNLNVLGTMLCIKHTLQPMIDAGGGSFIGMSSLAGHITHPWFGAYPVSKAGIEAMIRNAADENGVHNVRFNAIRPGFVATEIMEGIPRDGEIYQSYIVNTPLGDVGYPQDIGQLARFLVSPESRWITGQCINVDGGHSLRRGPDFSSFKA